MRKLWTCYILHMTLYALCFTYHVLHRIVMLFSILVFCHRVALSSKLSRMLWKLYNLCQIYNSFIKICSFWLVLTLHLYRIALVKRHLRLLSLKCLSLRWHLLKAVFLSSSETILGVLVFPCISHDVPLIQRLSDRLLTYSFLLAE